MTRRLYSEGIFRLRNGDLDWLTTVWKVALVPSSYVFDINHATMDDVSEIIATNYVTGHGGAGRHTVANKLVTRDTTLNQIIHVGDWPVWSLLGGAVNDTIASMVIAAEGTGDDSDAYLLGYWPEPFPLVTTGKTLSIIHATEGLFTSSL